jgi:predicted metalloprotease
MRWKRGRRSGDVIDRRGQPGLRGGGMPAIAGGGGLVGVIVVVLIMVLGGGGDLGGALDGLEADAPAAGPGEGPPSEERLVDFMSFVLDDAQNFWEDSFRQSGKQYRRAELVIFDASTRSQCGGAFAQTGPHYCPPDQRIYLDLDFFKELKNRFGAPGDFAQAYVLAHEVGHHVQNLLGILDEVHQDGSNEMSVKAELQADCFAGVWAFTTYQRDLLESGDLEEGLEAAAAVGDDTLQEQAGQRVNPESWTHGSSEQRMDWFRRGFEDGDPNACNTFA